MYYTNVWLLWCFWYFNWKNIICTFYLITFNDKIYLNTCDKQDDIWFYIVRILNNINCYIGNKPFLIKDITSCGLFANFNSKNNQNTISFQKTLQKLKELKYMN